MGRVRRYKREHWTRRGRVVYKRKAHSVQLDDIDRFIRAYFSRLLHTDPPVERYPLAVILYELSVRLLQVILNLVGIGEFAAVVYYYLIKLVQFCLDFLSKNLLASYEGPYTTYSLAVSLYGLVEQYLPPMPEDEDEEEPPTVPGVPPGVPV